MVDITKAFNPETNSVLGFFKSKDVGFYIPLYQREYSWDNDNIEQMFDDLATGVSNLLTNTNDEVRFLGTIITVVESNRHNIQPQDPRGLPRAVEKIIDGQQRLSTITLFCTILHKYICIEESKIKGDGEITKQLRESCSIWKENLLNVFSLDLGKGAPTRKPKIVRGNRDAWTKDGTIEKNYKSSMSNYLAKYIQFKESPITSKNYKKEYEDNVGKNLANIDTWVKNIVLAAHIKDEDSFPTAWNLIKDKNIQDYLWTNENSALADAINAKEITNKKSINYVACSLTQLFSVCYYLLDRCCFTVIQPINDDWAFDMFQSLNATGTPLTAIETFKPLVVNTVEQDGKKSFKGSSSETSFDKIEKLFNASKTAQKKSKLASEFLTSLRIVVDGGKLPTHFSSQRRWLDDMYNSKKFSNFRNKNSLINFFGNYAEFYKQVWTDYEGDEVISKISTHPEAELACILILYLKESNHKMSITVLALFYSKVIENEEDENIINEFIQVIKVVASFYTLWRSSKSNSGLDNVYREFFKGSKTENRLGTNWLSKQNVTLADIRDYLKSILEKEGISKKEDWIIKSKTNLSYNKSRSVCRLSLFIAAHDVKIDSNNPGLVTKGRDGIYPYLRLEKWTSTNLKTVEHIAPQENKKKSWDGELYKENELYQRVGNLTLLPLSINSSAGNKGWKEKYIYYKHLSEDNDDTLNQLNEEAKKLGINLAPKTINILRKSSYAKHIDSIVEVKFDGVWDSALVLNRTENICNLVWDRVNNWIIES
jgi:hypothetical protein